MLLNKPKLHIARQTPNYGVNQSFYKENKMPSLTPHYGNNECGFDPVKVMIYI